MLQTTHKFHSLKSMALPIQEALLARRRRRVQGGGRATVGTENGEHAECRASPRCVILRPRSANHHGASPHHRFCVHGSQPLPRGSRTLPRFQLLVDVHSANRGECHSAERLKGRHPTSAIPHAEQTLCRVTGPFLE